ncbi:MAG: biotin/lipoyl-binding protein [Bacteroidia bacterium]|nr:biotin/lipoyl-binding protein [Bacteroidia bacterium]
MFKATVNEKTFAIEHIDDSISVDGQPIGWDIVRLEDRHFHILHNNQSFRAELVSVDEAAHTVIVKINNRQHTVSVKNKFDLLLEQMGMTSGASNKVNSVKAPMPGLIIDLKVKEGDTVKQGQPLLILEAMKMENIIKAHGDAVVKVVKVKKGESVEKNQTLIEF